MNDLSSRRAVPVAIVHHANQYLITDGYDNRQGISGIVDGYVAALRLHDADWEAGSDLEKVVRP